MARLLVVFQVFFLSYIVMISYCISAGAGVVYLWGAGGEPGKEPQGMSACSERNDCGCLIPPSIIIISLRAGFDHVFGYKGLSGAVASRYTQCASSAYVTGIE